jgi:site-specific DNA-cytosine methylase
METWVLGKKGDSGWKPGPFAEAFPVDGELPEESQEVPALDFSFNSKARPFLNAGYAWKSGNGTERTPYRNMYWTTKVKAVKEEPRTIRDIMLTEHDPEYEIDADSEDFRKFDYVKGDLKEFRIRKKDKEKAEAITVGGSNLWEIYQRCTRGYKKSLWRYHRATFEKHLESGLVYRYQGGAMAFPDSKKKASRTVVTAEIGKSPSRMRHVIKLDDGTHRRLMPVELERLNEFPDGWTDIDGISDSRRGFLMGNALVVGVIARLRKPLMDLINRLP